MLLILHASDFLCLCSEQDDESVQRAEQVSHTDGLAAAHAVDQAAPQRPSGHWYLCALCVCAFALSLLCTCACEFVFALNANHVSFRFVVVILLVE